MAQIGSYKFCKLCAISTVLLVIGGLSLGNGGWMHLATSKGFSTEPFYYYLLGFSLILLAFHINNTHVCQY